MKKSKQKGKLVILLSEDKGHQGENPDFTFPEDVTIIRLPDWADEWKSTNDDWWGGIPNKYKSVEWLCDNNYFKNNDKLLFLDPDMAFINPIDYNLEDNQVIGQKFIHFTHLSDWKRYDNDEGIMYPFALKFSTLKKISKDYTNFCEQIRRQTGRWEAEMFGLDYAFKENNIDIKLIEDWGTCTDWNKNNDRDIIGNLIHYPNELLDKLGNRIFFKQDYTFTPHQKLPLHLVKNQTDSLLLTNVTQQRTDYLYHLKYNFDSIFKFYDGSKGYLIFEPYHAGFNNIRMSLELIICIAYLTNRTVVLPPPIVLLKGHSPDVLTYSDFFDTDDLGIKSISFNEFCSLKNVSNNLNEVKNISKILNYDAVNNIINFEKINPSNKFSKDRPNIKSSDYFTDDEYIFLDSNLLGISHQTLFTSLDVEIKKLVAKYIKFKSEIFDVAWQFINRLGDQQYYSIHIRRNDFQYEDVRVSAEKILENIKDIIPLGSKLYIATDHKDKSSFYPLFSKYNVIFYDTLLPQINIYKEFNVNWIPLIEQLICTRSIRFVGTKFSTLSSLIFRMRGYMNDIEDKQYYVNTEVFNLEEQCTFKESIIYTGNWVREYSDSFDFTDKTIFVSVASYCDSRVVDTLISIYSEALNHNRIFVGLHLQDTQEAYDELLKYDFPNLRIKFTLKENAQGVVWARNKIKEELYNNEDYFLQIDSHSRVKKNWDNILINQYENIDEDKVIISTYPNHFDMPDYSKNYLQVPYNAPLRVKRFLSEDLIDNRCVAENLSSLEDYQVVENRWVAAGFLFTKKEWLDEVKLPDKMRFNGEEDHLTFLSYLKGWNIRLPSEATVWHNYEFRASDTNEPYREHNNNYLINDESIQLVNDFLFNQTHTRTLEQLEEYFNIKLKKPKNNTIFVTIASYLDYEIKHTILDCISKAKHPENLHFGICLQYDENENTNKHCLDFLKNKLPIQVLKYHYTKSEGGCWARNIAQSLYNGEKYSLQVDSHTRFIQNWDEIVINDYNNLKQTVNKPLISFLPPPYMRRDELGIDLDFKHLDELDKIHIPKFTQITDEYWPIYGGYDNEQNIGFIPQNVIILYGGFVFSEGNWVVEVKQDPEHYYTGEEFALTIRSYTKGYDIYTPSQIVAWHRSHNSVPKKHFNNNPEEIANAKHRHAVNRLKLLIEGGDLGEYGAGVVRPIEEYEKFAGINLKNKTIIS